MVLENYAGVLAIGATLTGLAMAFSYFPEAYQIWKTKNVKGISPIFTIVLFFAAITWTLYGLSISNYPIIIPNAIATVGIILVNVLYFRYYKKSKK